MRTSAENAAPWQATAAYLYLLRLDVASLAWEYLRRYPAYLTAWLRDGRHGGASAARAWGLIQLEDPGLDARKAHPLWDDSLPALLHVEAAEAAAGGATGAGLLLWRLPGQKDLVALPNGAALQVRDGARLLRMRLGREYSTAMRHAAQCRSMRACMRRPPCLARTRLTLRPGAAPKPGQRASTPPRNVFPWRRGIICTPCRRSMASSPAPRTARSPKCCTAASGYAPPGTPTARCGRNCATAWRAATP